ncbi:hypothetical protein DFJ74DRAFT_417025 [Hyaloraphidium curvatum]|nr:hypothetical protein DFJ74DRAFT_417025 [Hyaloraphidium curvatum]
MSLSPPCLGDDVGQLVKDTTYVKALVPRLWERAGGEGDADPDGDEVVGIGEQPEWEDVLRKSSDATLVEADREERGRTADNYSEGTAALAQGRKAPALFSARPVPVPAGNGEVAWKTVRDGFYAAVGSSGSEADARTECQDDRGSVTDTDSDSEHSDADPLTVMNTEAGTEPPAVRTGSCRTAPYAQSDGPVIESWRAQYAARRALSISLSGDGQVKKRVRFSETVLWHDEEGSPARYTRPLAGEASSAPPASATRTGHPLQSSPPHRPWMDFGRMGLQSVSRGESDPLPGPAHHHHHRGPAPDVDLKAYWQNVNRRQPRGP